jgi:phosphohistidine phosphatase SixA
MYPSRLLFSFTLTALSVACYGPCSAQQRSCYIIRHSDKDRSWRGEEKLTPLLPRGVRRARRWADIFQPVKFDAVFSTMTLRSWQTATPTAQNKALKITPYSTATELSKLIARHPGQRVLIVGHSDTIGDIVHALGGQRSIVKLTDKSGDADPYDDLFIMRPGTKFSTAHLRAPFEKSGLVLESSLFQGHNGKKNKNDKNISAAARINDGSLLIVGTDEGHELQVLKRTGALKYQASHFIDLTPGLDLEVDIEGLAAAGNVLYAVGSHSQKRKKTKRSKSRKKNIEGLEQSKPTRLESRDKIFRIELDEGGQKSKIQHLDLRKIINSTKPLSLFSRLPAKENGIDIEGLAIFADTLYLGFRGPVLRQGYVPVGVLHFSKPDSFKLTYVKLGGRGVRSMTRVKDGFLILAGAVGDSDQSYQLYFWNGKSCVIGKDAAGGNIHRLRSVPCPDGGKAEGLIVLSEKNDWSYELLILYDGPKNGQSRKLLCLKPKQS